MSFSGLRHPENNSIVFNHLNYILKTGKSHTLELKDIGVLPPDAQVETIHNKFTKFLADIKNLQINNRSIFWPIVRLAGYGRIFCAIMFSCFPGVCAFAQPLILEALTKYQQNQIDLSPFVKWLLICLVFIIPLFATICKAHATAHIFFFGVQARNALTASIYQKTLRLNPIARSKYSVADISNLFTQDTLYIEQLFQSLANVIIFPAQILAALVLIYFQVGISMFIGFGYILFLFPFLSILAYAMQVLMSSYLTLKDERLSAINDILSGIRIVKAYAWEDTFFASIDKKRNKEMKELLKVACVWNITQFLFMSVPVLLPILVFYTYIRLDHTLTLSVAFTTLMLFSIIQQPIMWLPSVAQAIAQAVAAAHRIEMYLQEDDIESYIQSNECDGNCKIELVNCCTGWKSIHEDAVIDKGGGVVDGNKSVKPSSNYIVVTNTDGVDDGHDGDMSMLKGSSDRSIYTLMNINITIEAGQLVAVCGPVGSGKSSLLSTLLGEINLHSGSVFLNGKVSYHQQHPWILNTTILENILLGRELNERKLREVIEVCALDVDMKLLASGVHTEIGEKGVNLSGGQKARISLARALYDNECDIFLLDDPLSAVDASVSSILFYSAIKRYLRGKIVILVTHQIQYLRDCDLVILLDSGRISGVGTYIELKEKGLDIDSALMTHSESASGNEAGQEEKSSEKERSKTGSHNRKRTTTDKSKGDVDHLVEDNALDEQGVLTAKDSREIGHVGLSTYIMYLCSGGYYFYVLAALCGLATIGSSLWGDYHLSNWGTQSGLTSRENVIFLDGYAWRKIIGVFTNGLTFFFGLSHSFVAAKFIHAKLLLSVLRATISFFDVTPQGRIYTRFSNYMNAVDSLLVIFTVMTITGLSNLLGILGSIAYSTNGVFLLLLFPLAFIYLSIHSYYTASYTEVARLQNNAMGPMQIEFQQAVYGVVSIRAYSVQDSFTTRLHSRLNDQSAAYLLQKNLISWLGIRLDIIGSLVTFFVYVLCFATNGFVSPKKFVVAILCATQLPSVLSLMVEVTTELEAAYTNLEKLLIDMKNTPEEENNHNSDPESNMTNSVELTSLNSCWPQGGKVEFQSVVMGYRELPPVLNKISFCVNAGEKIGICGRTGSGKSSLLVALFRMEILREGKILIDDIDICSPQISLKQLRSNLILIPQDPVLFCNTLRFNLDPFDDHSDQEVWDALESINLKQTVIDLPNKLQEIATEGGNNFSAGQKQLFCFARAILRNPKVIVLDEATASVDNTTDNLIQSMIKEKFKNCTILTIAHRLNTIADYDRILVLDAGTVAEFDTFDALLRNNSGIFSTLWKAFESSHSQSSD